MTELKVYLSSSLNDRFRRIAMSVYGYGRGSLSKAAEDAFSKWCEQHEQTFVSLGGSSSAETKSVSSEQKTTLINLEERPGTPPETDMSGTANLKSAS